MYCRVPIGNGGDAVDNFLLSFRARWAWGKQSKSKTETTLPPQNIACLKRTVVFIQPLVKFHVRKGHGKENGSFSVEGQVLVGKR